MIDELYYKHINGCDVVCLVLLNNKVYYYLLNMTDHLRFMDIPHG